MFVSLFVSLFLLELNLFGAISFCRAGSVWLLPEDYCKEDPCNFPWGGELARSWPRVGQLSSTSVYKTLLGGFRTVFLLPRARTKSGWLEVDQQLDMGCQLLTRTFRCWDCRGLSCSSPLATPKDHRGLQGAPPSGRQLYFTFPSAPDHLFKASECTKIARFSAVAAAIFTAPPQNRAIFKAPRCAISAAKKIASERRFSLQLKGTNLFPTAEFPAIPESAAKIASERLCAILVHSAKRQNTLSYLKRAPGVHHWNSGLLAPAPFGTATFDAHRDEYENTTAICILYFEICKGTLWHKIITTKNVSEIIIFEKLRISRVISGNCLSFPEILRVHRNNFVSEGMPFCGWNSLDNLHTPPICNTDTHTNTPPMSMTDFWWCIMDRGYRNAPD